jgi:hypothetical protein
VQLIVTDNDGLADTVSSTVEVAQATASEAAAQVAAEVQSLTGALRNRGEAQSLLTKVRAIQASVARGNDNSLLGQLGALENEIDALVRSGRITAAQAQSTLNAITRLRRAAE